MTKRLLTFTAANALMAGPAVSQDLIQPIGEGPFSWVAYQSFADQYDFSGEALEVLGASTGRDKDKLENLFAYFEEATGATVTLSGSDSFEQDIVIAAESQTLPDIAMFPQPGLAADMAGRGVLVPLDDANRQWFEETFAAGSSWADLVTYPGPEGDEHIYGTIFGADVKSLVWYAPEIFDEAGYEVPETMEELKALTERIVEDGETPWCIGLGAGNATGWPATDWVEEFVLRTQPPEVYDQWVTNEIPFDDPRIVAAIEEYGWFARNDDFVAGGSDAVATTDFRDSPAGLFSFPPECYLHRQASFVPNFFPSDVEVGLDADFFYFPAYADKELGKPVLGSGGVISMTSDRDISRAFVEFLKTPVAHELQISQGQFLTPHLEANTETYATETQAAQGEILTNASTFRFDGSDLMPSEIGTSAFWEAMVDYQTGASAGDVAAAVQERWSRIK
ncbi:alpha-glucoside transport system substrate-binding protein [Tranquillimonas rosea]|uniref:Alpha-glucoside transport system substrate-binding protein n=1 Tax=Tranquillimonas rosea TaxID=641238 RepID=A0A1H9SLH2_9RHOB|nr:ABC transporter substrate-binding protein [Tranquillimonas rosea]SER85801.1 alpha-glucoside transport system substrate-binding protein [Tranquillimonas rosea]